MSENVEYIEKQTVRKIIEGWKPNEDDYDTHYDYLATFDLWGGCCCAITAAPSADVAPVVHGHWIKVENARNVFKCSRCGHIRELRHISEIISKPKLCEECGAKMDESEGEK